MSKMRREEIDRMRELLVDAIATLCRSGMKYKSEMRVEGLLGVTLDEDDIILVNVNKTYEMPQYGKKSQLKQKIPPRKIPSPDEDLQMFGDYKIKEATMVPPMKQGKPRAEPIAMKSPRYPGSRVETNPIPVMRQGPQRMEMYERSAMKPNPQFRGDVNMGMIPAPMRYNQTRGQYTANMAVRHPQRTDINVGMPMKYPQPKTNICPPMKIAPQMQMRTDTHAGIPIKQERQDTRKIPQKADVHAGVVIQTRTPGSSPMRQSQSRSEALSGAIVKPIQKSEQTASSPSMKSTKTRPQIPMKQDSGERISDPAFRVKTEPPDEHGSYSMSSPAASSMVRIKTEPLDEPDEYSSAPSSKRLKTESQPSGTVSTPSSSQTQIMESETTGAIEPETWSEDSQHFQQLYSDELAEADREMASESATTDHLPQTSRGIHHDHGIPSHIPHVKLEVTSEDELDEYDEEDMYGYYDEHGEYHEYEEYEEGFYGEYGEEMDEHGEMYDPNDPGMPLPADHQEHGEMSMEQHEMGEEYSQGEGGYHEPEASPDQGLTDATSATPTSTGKMPSRGAGNKMNIPCPVCSKTYANKTNLQRHIKRIHTTIDHICPHCHVMYSQAEKLQHHIDTVHPSKPKEKPKVKPPPQPPKDQA